MVGSTPIRFRHPPSLSRAYAVFLAESEEILSHLFGRNTIESDRDAVRTVLRLHHYSMHTERSYVR